MVAMEMGPSTCEKAGVFARGWCWFKSFPQKFASGVVGFTQKMKKVGQDDPRKIIHSLKVGLALTLVSSFYYFQPTYDSFGVSAMWAVMTVVVVFEFTVGATLGKGINRGLATLTAGALGVGAHHLAALSGHTGEPIILGLFVFLQAAATTFLRFNPEVKAKYDYGLLIFILTFSLVSVSGYREGEIWEFAHKRLSTIIIGSCACVIISVVVCPVWAGQDLHNNISSNMEKLGSFLEGFGSEYFRTSEAGESKDDENEKSFLQEYKSVLNSKASEDSLANFARWEPAHGRFKFRHPWHQYLKIGTLTRECAYRIDALHSYLTSDVQTPPEIRKKLQATCTLMSAESGRALKEVGVAVRSMRHPSLADPHIANSKSAAKKLKSLLQSGGGLPHHGDLLAVMPAATVASLLTDVVSCTEKIADSARELASLARFKNVDPTVSPEKSQPRHQNDAVRSIPLGAESCPHVVIPMNSLSSGHEKDVRFGTRP